MHFTLTRTGTTFAVLNSAGETVYTGTMQDAAAEWARRNREATPVKAPSARKQRRLEQIEEARQGGRL